MSYRWTINLIIKNLSDIIKYIFLGVTQKVNYLKDLGIGAIWLSPIFESPQFDFGYDISNFKQIEKVFGTLADFDRLLNTYHNAGKHYFFSLPKNIYKKKIEINKLVTQLYYVDSPS